MTALTNQNVSNTRSNGMRHEINLQSKKVQPSITLNKLIFSSTLSLAEHPLFQSLKSLVVRAKCR